MLSLTTYTARKAGAKLLVLGAVHGNEKCGTVAIKRVMARFESGELTLQKGSVTFIPVCNPRAYAQNVRYTERNLNRYLVPMEKPDCYEAELGNILCPQLAACDYLLDLHSYTAGGPPFMLTRTHEEEIAFARAVGPHAIITGWAEAYAATGRTTTSHANPNESVGTGEYAQRNGAVAVTIECGQHHDPTAPDVAERAILDALRYLRFAEEQGAVLGQSLSPPPAPIITMTHVYYRDDEGHFAKPWQHLDSVKAGDVLAYSSSGVPITAPHDSIIIMPKIQTPLGEEWFYLGRVEGV